jgi:hypothetical protein
MGYDSAMFKQRRYRPDPDSYFLVESQRGKFAYHGTPTMSAFEEMCSKTQVELKDLIRVQERRRGDDPELDPPIRRLSRADLAKICDWPV